MTRAWLAAGLIAALGAGPAGADPRLVERLYNPHEVVRVEGRPNVQATIRFGDDEHIENVAIGDSTKWQVTPNRRTNLLFVKPLGARAATNMTVVTDRHTYLFDLVASPLSRAPLYVLSFTYPPETAPAGLNTPLAGSGAAPTGEELAAASDPYAVVDPSRLNFAWRTKGAPQLLPARIFDDGRATFLTWPGGTALPAILVRNQEGTEGPVNYAVRGEVIVVEGVPREIVLRSGKDAANLINDRPVGGSTGQQPALAQANPLEVK
ncbi:MAG: TrbG/VirB9 family P-type conjugative transfer protein [Croceibacterium sp.]